jgi:hypothetical protein
MKFERFSKNLVMDASTSMYPSLLTTHADGETAYEDKTSTYYGIVLNGQAELVRQGLPNLSLAMGMYFSAVGPFKLKGGAEVAVIRRFGYRGLFTVGGPCEDHGRLVYIDNCTTSILIPPARAGEPVFNLLVFPPNVEQTMHIHPTVRMGVVLAGNGSCITPKNPPQPLEKGMAFYLAESAAHCFYSGPQGMSIIAYHPDSEGGPMDTNHPMLNRTYTKF